MELKSNDRIDITNDYIMFKTLLTEDNGTYTVNVSNIIGSSSFDIDFEVYCKYHVLY